MRTHLISLLVLAFAALACSFSSNASREDHPYDQPYSTDFSTDTADWETTEFPEGSLRRVQDGMYRIFVKRDGMMVSVLGYEQIRYSGDVQIEVEIIRVEGPTDNNFFGVLCRYALTGENQGDYYGLHVSVAGQAEIFKVSNGKYKSLASEKVNFRQDTPNTLLVKCVGETLSLNVNNEVQITARDSDLKGEYVGLVVAGKGSDVYFDNFSVTVP